MRRSHSTSAAPKIALLMFLLACLQKPALTLAADPPKFDSPAAVTSAAEDAFVNRDFKAFADCFDAAGQKLLNEDSIQLLAVFASLTPDGHGKQAKEVLAKYGLTDLSKQGDESSDHYAERLCGQLKDPHGFMVEAMPIANPESYRKKPPKGELKNLKIDGTKATATFAIKVTPKYTLTQDMTYIQTAGSWKITSDINFPGTAEIDSQ